MNNINTNVGYRDFFRATKSTSISPNVNTKELALGILREKENTNDKNLAKAIALQHLQEDARYYSKLERFNIKETYGVVPTHNSPAVADPSKRPGKNIAGKIGGTTQVDTSNSGDKLTPQNPTINTPAKTINPSRQSDVNEPSRGKELLAKLKQRIDPDNNAESSCDCDDNIAQDEPEINADGAVVIDIRENFKKIVKECIKRVLKEEGYGSYKVAGKSYREFSDSPQFPNGSVFNPQVREESGNKEVHEYEWVNNIPQSRRTQCVLSLRKDGYTAYEETNSLFTNASISEIGLACGTTSIIKLK